MPLDRAKFIAELEAMTVLELKDLVTALEEHFGVTDNQKDDTNLKQLKGRIYEKNNFNRYFNSKCNRSSKRSSEGCKWKGNIRDYSRRK